ncbi:MAG TPA: ABC transporter permease, partial [Clostridia bacterium]|nr:ABC transporter permease [Clostridia bacterium]
ALSTLMFVAVLTLLLIINLRNARSDKNKLKGARPS